MIGDIAVEAHGVDKRYGAKHVLRDLDLTVRRGEVFCLLGPNGAGKTTTVEILEGFRTPEAGTIRVLGLDPATQPLALRQRVGIVLQECGFPRHLRVGELLDAWRTYYPTPRRLDELLDVVELASEATTPVRKLSGGQRRRLDFALALAGDPDLIFLDEPTTGFDPEARRRCWAAIENLRTLDKTIVLTTHYLDEAEHLADTIAILTDGHIDQLGTAQHLARAAGALTHIRFTAPPELHDGTIPSPDGLALTVDGHRVDIAVEDPWSALRGLFAWSDRHDLTPFRDLAVVPPRLEDTYLHLIDPQPTGTPR